MMLEGGVNMDYMKLMSKAIDFMHNQYDENILVADICEQVHLSPSHFSYIFRTLIGITAKDYLNRYRLYRAAVELKETNKRIIEIVFDNGFSSQQAFTKNFSQAYGISPAQFRKAHIPIITFPPSNIMKERGISMDINQSFENVIFESKGSFYVIGIETDINYNGIGKGTGYIADLYERWNSECFLDQIPDRVNGKVIYGITHEETEDDAAKYMICAEVSSLANIPSGFIGRKFNTCEYAIFETTLDVIFAGEFWRYFFKTWANEQGFEIPEVVYSKRNNILTRCPAFEVYDETWKDSSSIIKIYAPILRK